MQHSHDFKRRGVNFSVDGRQLRALRRSTDRKSWRDDLIMKRRCSSSTTLNIATKPGKNNNILTPLKEKNEEVADDLKNKKQPTKKLTGPEERRLQLNKYKERKQLLKELEKKEKENKPVFKVCQVNYKFDPFASLAPIKGKRVKPVIAESTRVTRSAAKIAATVEKSKEVGLKIQPILKPKAGKKVNKIGVKKEETKPKRAKTVSFAPDDFQFTAPMNLKYPSPKKAPKSSETCAYEFVNEVSHVKKEEMQSAFLNILNEKTDQVDSDSDETPEIDEEMQKDVSLNTQEETDDKNQLEIDSESLLMESGSNNLSTIAENECEEEPITCEMPLADLKDAVETVENEIKNGQNIISESEKETQDATPVEDELLVAKTDENLDRESTEGQSEVKEVENETAETIQIEDEVPVATTNDEVSVAKTDEEVPVAKTDEEVPVAKTDEEVLVAITDEEVSVAKTDDEVPVAKTDDEVPVAKTDDEVPVAKTDDEVPVAKTDDEVPVAKTDDEVPVAKTDEEVPVAKTDDEVPVAKTDDEVPVAKTDDEVPVAKTDDDLECGISPFVTISRGSSSRKSRRRSRKPTRDRSLVKNYEQEFKAEESREKSVENVTESEAISDCQEIRVNANISPKTKVLLDRFKGLVTAHKESFGLKINYWINIKNEDDLPALAGNEIDVAIGMAELLMRQRFSQFEDLIADCEFKRGEKLTTCDDLLGFWEMIFHQVINIEAKFDKLDQMKKDNWKSQTPKPKKGRRRVKKMTPKPKPKAKPSQLREHIMAARKSKQTAPLKPEEVVSTDSNDSESRVTRSTAKRDGSISYLLKPSTPGTDDEAFFSAENEENVIENIVQSVLASSSDGTPLVEKSEQKLRRSVRFALSTKTNENDDAPSFYTTPYTRRQKSLTSSSSDDHPSISDSFMTLPDDCSHSSCSQTKPLVSSSIKKRKKRKSGLLPVSTGEDLISFSPCEKRRRTRSFSKSS